MLDPTLTLLLFVQIAMGGFDTIWHHELTQRLAWRAGQGRELRLHGVRNLAYAILFAALGIATPSGGWAVALLCLLVGEAILTLWDFVEEDRTSALPATERVLHTLLTLNYGVILALLVPRLWALAGAPSAIEWAWHGVVSALFLVAAAGVIVSGLRDLAAARRSDWLVDADPAGLIPDLRPDSVVLVTGGTGLVGRRLVAALVAAGHRAIVLTRETRRAAKLPAPVTIVTDLDQISARERIDAVVNLAGESIAGGLWTRKRKAEMRRSRIEMTQAVDRLVARLHRASAVLVQGSAVGFYGSRGDEVLDEGSGPGRGFAAGLCADWEAEAGAVAERGVRVVRLRTGLVLSREGGLLANLLFAFEWGLGGRVGDGGQWMSWIHRDDLVRLIGFAIATPDLAGAINAVAPTPVRNRDFTRALAGAFRRPAFLPLPAGLLRAGLGEFADELFLASQRALPVKAVFHGFTFRHPRIEGAIADLVGAEPARAARSREANAPLAEARLLH